MIRMQWTLHATGERVAALKELACDWATGRLAADASPDPGDQCALDAHFFETLVQNLEQSPRDFHLDD
jgi:hypothetical protein